MMLAMLALALVQQPVPGPDSMAGRPCQVVIDTVGHSGRQVEVRPGETNLFAGGGVRAHCRGTNSTLVADSLAWFAGVGRLDLLGGVQIRDTAVSIDAVTASYFLRQERLEAHKNVVAVSRATGSVLRGPNLTYYRVAKGIRDTAEMYATSRPTITYRATGDSGEPYVILADRFRMKGNDRIWAGGSATIDRSDLATQSDSLMRDEAAGIAVLIGKPQVQGKGARNYRLLGRRIEFALQQREIRLVKSLGAGQAIGADWRLTADTIHLMMGHGELQDMLAWGDSSHPMAHYRDTRSTSKRSPTDSAAENWIAGDTITAHWIEIIVSAPGTANASPNSTPKSTIDRLVARGSARAFTHIHNQRDSTTAPSLNYSRGAIIDIAMKGERIDRVTVTGKANGMHLEPIPPAPPSPPPRDTTRSTKRSGS
jgi:hypothetical protein